MASTRVHRLVRLLTVLQGATDISAGDLMHELSVSRRTLFRDLAMLRDAGVPVYHDPEAGYRVHRSFYLPPINLTVPEVVGLLLMAKLTAADAHLPMTGAALSAVRKLGATVPPELRTACADLVQPITVAPGRPPAHDDDDAEERWFGLLQRCIDEGRACAVVYRAAAEPGEQRFELEPAALHFENRAWYVLGRTDLHREVRVLKLSRVASLRELDRRFTPRPGAEVVREKLGACWRLIPEGKVYGVEVVFSAKVAPNVEEVRWHPSQRAARRRDGRLRVRFEVDGLGEIAWWLCGYAGEVEVRRPAALRARVKAMHRAALRALSAGENA